MVQLLVIADDFTGALDTGVQFSNQGAKTLVTTNKELDIHQLDDDVEVLVIDSESRYLAPQDAFQGMEKILEAAKQAAIPFIYKKVDSALRGNISSEIGALVAAFPGQSLPFVPAFPTIHRIVKNGHLYIDGVLVSESAFAKDPYEPVLESDIAKRLKEEAGLESQLLSPGQSIETKKNVLLFDSQTHENLIQIAQDLEGADLLSVSIGCAGFAKVLAQRLFSKREAREQKLIAPLLVICGSVNEVTQKQVAFIEKNGGCRVSLSAEQLMEQDYWQSGSGQTFLEEQLSKGKNKVMVFETMNPYTFAGFERLKEDQKFSSSEIRFQIGRSLGQLAQAILATEKNFTVLFTGGDTLYQSMQVLGVTDIRPVAELESGVVLAELSLGGEVIQVITKSGGFGQESLFADLQAMSK